MSNWISVKDKLSECCADCTFFQRVDSYSFDGYCRALKDTYIQIYDCEIKDYKCPLVVDWWMDLPKKQKE